MPRLPLRVRSGQQQLVGHPDLSGPGGVPGEAGRTAATALTWAGLTTAAGATALVAFYVIFHNGSWVYDDNFILTLAHRYGLNLTWLKTPVYQHWNPGMNAVFSVLLHLFPLDWRWGLLAALLGLAAMIGMFAATFSLLARSGLTVFVLTVWFAFSILWTPPLQWWTFSVQIFPNLFFDLLCLYAYLRFQTEGRTRWVLISALSLAAGLLFYEKAAFMLIYLGLMRVLLLGEPLRVGAQLRGFWRERRIWAAYVVVVLAWGAGYLGTGAYSAGQGGVPVTDWLRYFRILWVQTLVPLVAGLSVPVSNLSAAQTAGVAVLQLLVLGAVAFTVARWPRTALNWIFLVLTVVVTGLLVARSRIFQFGVTVGGDRRYLMDFSILLPLVACALIQRGSLVSPRERNSRAVLRSPLRRGSASPGLLALLAVSLVAYAVLSLHTATALEKNWPTLSPRHWYENVNHGLARYGVGRRPATIADNEVPFQIMGSWEDPYSRLSSVLPLYASSVQVDGAIRGPLLTVGGDGTIAPARLRVLPQATNAYRASPLLRGANRQGFGCYDTGSGVEMVTRSVRPPAGLGTTSAPLYVLIGYRVPRPVDIAVYLGTGPTLTAVPNEVIRLDPGAHQAIAWLRYGALRSFGLQIAAHSSLCLNRIRVVEAAP